MKHLTALLLTLVVALHALACGSDGPEWPAPPADAAVPTPDAGIAWFAGPSCNGDADCPAARPTCFVGSCVKAVDVPLGCGAPPSHIDDPVLPPSCDDGDPCTDDLDVGGACYHQALPDGTACLLFGYVPGYCGSGYCCSPSDAGT